MWLLDRKIVELPAWAPIAQPVAGPDGEDALALLREVRGVMDEPYRELLAREHPTVLRQWSGSDIVKAVPPGSKGAARALATFENA